MKAPRKKIERTKAPHRSITKRQALRHAIHAAVRLTLRNEDPFAIHMLVQSADKISLDLLKVRSIRDPFDFEERIIPERRREFFDMHREVYNFFKHAKRDADDTLDIYDIVNLNDGLLFAAIMRYGVLFKERTEHMAEFFGLYLIMVPAIFKWDQIPDGSNKRKIVESNRHQTRGELIEFWSKRLTSQSKLLVELRDDLQDVHRANNVELSGKVRRETRIRLPMK